MEKCAEISCATFRLSKLLGSRDTTRRLHYFHSSPRISSVESRKFTQFEFALLLLQLRIANVAETARVAEGKQWSASSTCETSTSAARLPPRDTATMPRQSSILCDHRCSATDLFGKHSGSLRREPPNRLDSIMEDGGNRLSAEITAPAGTAAVTLNRAPDRQRHWKLLVTRER
jgi:hypothetical protein